MVSFHPKGGCMKISDFSPGRVDSVKSKKIDKKPSSSTETSSTSSARPKGDQVSLSTASQQMQSLKALYETAPDIKAKRIEDIKTAIESGQYKPDFKEVAGALVQFVQES